MRYIGLLPDIQLTEVNGSPILHEDKPVVCTHADFLLGRLADQEFSTDIDSIAIGLVIRDKLLGKPKKWISLEDAHWLKLCASCRSPRGNGNSIGYNPNIAHNFHDAIQAVLRASDKDPATKKAVEK